MWLLGVVACAAPTDPVWAFDPMWVEPVGDGIQGFQTWNLYDARWESNHSERAFVCSVVVQIAGEPTSDLCEGCTAAWLVTPTLLESDCDDGVSVEPGFLSLAGVALGPVPSSLGDDDPYPGQSVGGYADYGDGWMSHGWAYPDALDLGDAPAGVGWGDGPYRLWPAFVWQYGDAEG
jgi:hypothetical protein